MHKRIHQQWQDAMTDQQALITDKETLESKISKLDHELRNVKVANGARNNLAKERDEVVITRLAHETPYANIEPDSLWIMNDYKISHQIESAAKEDNADKCLYFLRENLVAARHAIRSLEERLQLVPKDASAPAKDPEEFGIEDEGLRAKLVELEQDMSDIRGFNGDEQDCWDCAKPELGKLYQRMVSMSCLIHSQ